MAYEVDKSYGHCHILRQGMGYLLLTSDQSCVCKPYIPATVARIAGSAQTVTEKSLKSRQHALNKLTWGPSSLLVKALYKTLFPSAMCRRFTMILACTESCEVIASISDTDLVFYYFLALCWVKRASALLRSAGGVKITFKFHAIKVALLCALRQKSL
jgi:hypothetical protein